MPDETTGEDKVLKCVDCGAEFTFSARDQSFYQEKGWRAPRRCRNCRDKRKSGQTPTLLAGRDATGADPAAAPGGPQQFKVSCSTCGVETTVPFKPDPKRPVYCRTCYLQRRKSS